MVLFTEDKTFTLRFNLEASFSEEYEGEEDGYAWLKEWESTIKPELLRAVRALLYRSPGWSMHVRNRGKSQDDEIEFVLSKEFPARPETPCPGDR